MNQLINTLNEYLVKKAPAIPANIKEILVKYAPWIVIIGIVVSIPAILAILGLGSITYSIMGSYFAARVGFQYTLSIVFLAASIILKALSVPGLMAKSLKGWNFVFYGILVEVVYSLLSGNILGGIIGVLISLYVLFQVKTYYK